MSTATDEKVELDVDFEKKVPCCAKGCDVEAAWGLCLRPCGHQGFPMCDEHKRHDEGLLRHLAAYCELCWRRVDRVDWVTL